MLQFSLPRQRQTRKNPTSRAMFYFLLSTIINILFTKISYDLYTQFLAKVKSTTRQGNQFREREEKKAYIKECYYNECQWVRITIINAFVSWLQSSSAFLHYHACPFIILSLSKTVEVETEGNRAEANQAIIPPTVNRKIILFVFNKNKHLPPNPCRKRNNPTRSCHMMSFQCKSSNLKWR